MKDIIITIIGALLGVVFSYIVPAIFDYIKYSKNKNVIGEWNSLWQPKNNVSGDYVKEKITISSSFGKFKFTNSENDLGYSWEGIGYIKYEKHIFGKWKSTKQGAHSKGAFLLSISPQGNFMFGEIVGPNDSGAIKNSPFILGRTDNDISLAKEWLENNL